MQPPEGPGTNIDQARVTTPPRRLRWPNRYSSRARPALSALHLTEALEAEGYSVLAMTRHPDTYAGAGKPIFGDVYEPDSLRSALADADAAYYLVHSLAREDFVEKDAAAARSFGTAAADAGLERVIYLGGLGSG